MSFDEEKKNINVKLSFMVDEEEEVDLELNGNLHRSQKGEVGVEWSKVEGHDYWLSAVEGNLNESLQGLV